MGRHGQTALAAYRLRAVVGIAMPAVEELRTARGGGRPGSRRPITALAWTRPAGSQVVSLPSRWLDYLRFEPSVDRPQADSWVEVVAPGKSQVSSPCSGRNSASDSLLGGPPPMLGTGGLATRCSPTNPLPGCSVWARACQDATFGMPFLTRGVTLRRDRTTSSR